MQPDDLDLISACGRPSLTPDGGLAVVAVTRPDVADDAEDGGLWVVDTTTGRARRLTAGPRDTEPRVSPDGSAVVFLRADDGPGQLHLVRLDGGEPVRLTEHPLGAGPARWSPDGDRLAYAARVPELGRYGTADPDRPGSEAPAPTAEAPRRITELSHRVDGLGWTRDRRHHVFVVDVPDLATTPGAAAPGLPGQPVQLTDGDQDDTDPVWHPDGRRLAFRTRRHATRERDLRSGVHEVDVPDHLHGDDPDRAPDGPRVVVTAVRALVEPDLAVGAACWTDDGRLVVVGARLGDDGLDFAGRQPQLWIRGTDSVELVALTRSADLHVAAGSEDLVVRGGSAVVPVLHRGEVRLVAVDLDGVDQGADDVTPLLTGPLAVLGHAMTPDGSVVVASVSTPDRPGDLALVHEGSPRWLTDTGRRLRAAGLVEVRETSSGGEHPVHGWVLLPDPDRFGEGPYPLLLTVHGGPHAAYEWGFFDEAQVYAGAGYAVLMGNPRGSAGYGEQHSRAIAHAMGTVDVEDVLAFLDHALADPDLPLDATRVGVMGGSYGGYMTATLTARTDRFVAAVVERGYLDAVSFVGSSDIGWFFPAGYHADAADAREHSPMTHVDRVTTPTLVIHSEADWRCPVEQGQRWFTHLRLRDVPTELVLFPGEGHELSRSGRPRHRHQRFVHVLRWWAEHLPA